MSRLSELRRLEELLLAVRTGRSASLVLVGTAGIGKSWLCRRAAEAADGFTVARTRGLESERHFSYGGLFDVLTPLLEGRLERLLPARAEALKGALRIAASPAVDPFTVAVASLDLLALAAEDAPLLVVVDDAPWVDAASLEALRFATRRLHADRVGFVFAARDVFAEPFADVESLVVGGLDTAESVELINAVAAAAVDPSVALALAAAGDGHPLWLRAAARELTPEQMTGAAPLTEPFTVPAAFQRAVLALPAPVRHALAVLAADEQAPAVVTERALIDLGITPDALHAGLGLTQSEAGGPRFTHPLALSAVREATEPARRRLAHEALARAWSDAGEDERAAWHLAEAGEGPDAHVSSTLAQVARDARSRGAPGTAAEAWRRAIETATDGAQLLRLERARDLADAGRAAEALAEVDEILDRGGDAELRADAEGLQGQLLISQGRLAHGAEVLAGAAAAIRGREPARAALMLGGAAFATASLGDLADGVAIAEDAVSLATPLGGPSLAAAESTLGWVLVIEGNGARGYPLLLRHAASGDLARRSLNGEFVPARLGLFACWMEDYDTARRELERAVAIARERGLVSRMPLALGALAELEFRVGNWVAARACAQDALRMARDADQFLHFGHTVLLVLDAATGDAAGTSAYADIIAEIATHSGSRTLAMHAHAGRGLLELGLDHPEAAIGHLLQTREIAARDGVGEPNYVQFMPNLIESQIRAGLEDDARVTLADFDAQAQRTGRRWALATAARCRGLLAPPETADAIFAEAHRLAAAEPSPFERARTDLCWGERLRRDGRRVEARLRLHDALAGFEDLGAAPWAEKAARELRSSGGRAQRGPRARSRELTAQEAQIATMVAEGKTNKTIAASLFLSPKTIEFHLSHVYRKLDVSNRTQLARALLAS